MPVWPEGNQEKEEEGQEETTFSYFFPRGVRNSSFVGQPLLPHCSLWVLLCTVANSFPQPSIPSLSTVAEHVSVLLSLNLVRSELIQQTETEIQPEGLLRLPLLREAFRAVQSDHTFPKARLHQPLSTSWSYFMSL